MTAGNGLQEKRMGDPALFDTICITAAFFGIASVLVLSVLYLERFG
ncbi:small membrane protein YoaI [Cedecea sp. NFIX57]